MSEPIDKDKDKAQDPITSDVEKPDVPKVDARLKKSVEMLIKQSKVDPKKLDGLTLEDQFDKLTFLIENVPEPKKEPNKPIIPLPNDTNEMVIGRKVKDVVSGKDFYFFKPEEWIKDIKKK